MNIVVAYSLRAVCAFIAYFVGFVFCYFVGCGFAVAVLPVNYYFLAEVLYDLLHFKSQKFRVIIVLIRVSQCFPNIVFAFYFCTLFYENKNKKIKQEK